MTMTIPARANADYDIVIFDLDGTLIDSRLGIHASIVHTLTEMGAASVDTETLSRFIGPPLIDSFQSISGMTEQGAARAVDVYKEYFAVEGIKGFEVYEGVSEMLWLLRASGVRMAIATTKDEVFAREIALTADFLPFLDAVIGSDREGRMLRKPELIAAALHAVERHPPDHRLAPRIVMVGDHALDIHGAKANGIESIGVAYGFGDDEELRKAQPNHMAATVTDLRDLLLGV